MGIKPRNPMSEIHARMEKAKLEVEKATLATMIKLGEQAVKHAKSVPASVGFRDQTGNLRSSIGYSVYLNGKQMQSSFSGTQEGVANGTEYCREVAADYPTGWLLVVVAGMEYAIKVESRGKDVLSSAENLVWLKMPGELERLKAAIKRAKFQ